MMMVVGWACEKDDFTSAPDAGLRTSVAELFFDTVFTGVGSVTKQIVVNNPNSKKLRLQQLALGGGAASPFSLNFNGQPGHSFSNLELPANDSGYLFVRLTVNPTTQNLPFLLKDSITLRWNGNTTVVHLEAYGQNARFLRNWRVTKDTNWTADLPIVVASEMVVNAGATLSVAPGTKIYCNANAPVVVNGSLQCLGQKDAGQIVFRGDRTDAGYSDLPGAWPGLIFTATSTNNRLHHTQILNAYQAVLVGTAPQTGAPKLVLQACRIQNAYDLGLYALGSNLEVENTLIAQCGNDGQPGVGGSNLVLAGGGKYRFNHCTVATYANLYQSHKQPAVFITNNGPTGAGALSVVFSNSIIYGQGGLADDEVVVQRTAGGAFSVAFEQVLYRAKNPVTNASFSSPILNQNPAFDSINTGRQTYNFRLRSGSPALDTASSILTTDLDGLPRPVGRKPDLGCYERQ
jgi:hypothetical protein